MKGRGDNLANRDEKKTVAKKVSFRPEVDVHLTHNSERRAVSPNARSFPMSILEGEQNLQQQVISKDEFKSL